MLKRSYYMKHIYTFIPKPPEYIMRQMEKQEQKEKENHWVIFLFSNTKSKAQLRIAITKARLPRCSLGRSEMPYKDTKHNYHIRIQDVKMAAVHLWFRLSCQDN